MVTDEKPVVSTGEEVTDSSASDSDVKSDSDTDSESGPKELEQIVIDLKRKLQITIDNVTIDNVTIDNVTIDNVTIDNVTIDNSTTKEQQAAAVKEWIQARFFGGDSLKTGEDLLKILILLHQGPFGDVSNYILGGNLPTNTGSTTDQIVSRVLNQKAIALKDYSTTNRPTKIRLDNAAKEIEFTFYQELYQADERRCIVPGARIGLLSIQATISLDGIQYKWTDGLPSMCKLSMCKLSAETTKVVFTAIENEEEFLEKIREAEQVREAEQAFVKVEYVLQSSPNGEKES